MAKRKDAPGNSDLNYARAQKKDDFFTLYEDIAAEVEAYVAFDPDVFRGKTVLCPCDDPASSNFTKYFTDHFARLGLRRLISTTVAPTAPTGQMSLFPAEAARGHGKLGTLDADGARAAALVGDGDFRSPEVTDLLRGADVVVTNPPFSQFRDFLKWIMDAGKQFLIIGSINAATFKEVFPLIRDDRIWLGATIHSGDRKFYVPEDYPLRAAGCGVDETGRPFIRVNGVRWFTNLDHAGRHAFLPLRPMAENLAQNEKLRRVLRQSYGAEDYPRFTHYRVLEVPVTEAIPSDYDGAMAVPVTFLDKYNPEQFEIVSANDYRADASVPLKSHGLIKDKEAAVGDKTTYVRICIRRRART